MSNSSSSSFSGFKLKSNSTSASNSTERNKQSRLQTNYPLQPFVGQQSQKQSYGASFSRKHATEDDYFESGNDDEDDYSKAGSKKFKGDYQKNSDSSASEEEEEEDDPLDSFMAGIEKTAKKDLESMGKKKDTKKEDKGIREDIEGEDDEESYYRWLEENPNAGVIQGDNDDEQDLEFDDDGNIIAPEKSKIIEPLPRVDHSTIEYEPFERNFYEEHDDIKSLDASTIDTLRKSLDIKVFGLNPPKPVCSFAHFNFDEQLMKAIRKFEYTQPTAIQSQAIPAALSGRDIIGIAKTGSGKTAAFLWPALIHIMNQKQLEHGDGPIVLILAPTRELAQQIYSETKKFAKVYNISSTCAYGGGSLYEQTLACEQGVDILICTPGRLIDLIKKKGTNLQRVTYLVLDEADRMFDMGFEPQVRSITNNVRPTRQTLLFSATFKKRIEKLAREILVDPIKIVQGELGEANENITQIVHMFTEGPEKWNWLNDRLVEFTSVGKVLIFVTKKANSIELEGNLVNKGYKVGLLHGDMHQDDRNKVIQQFRTSQEISILVATDVAARGLDIPAIKTVINYDVARDIDTHTHRIGRTGRAGEKGTAYTLITPKDKEFCPHLVRNLEGADQEVPKSLLDLASQVPWFKSQRNKQQSKNASFKFSGKSLGQRQRPGFGLNSNSSSSPSSSIERKPAINLSGPQTNRVAALKQAFTTQFKSHFVSASSPETSFKTSSMAVPSTALSPSQKSNEVKDNTQKPKKSRWDTS